MVLIWIIAAAAVVIDQLSKMLTVGFFFDPDQVIVQGVLSKGESLTMIPNVFSFTYVINNGAAFGILQNQQVFFLIATAAICTAGVILLLRIEKKHILLKLASGLVFGGAIGNLIDRLLIGSVRDFLHADVVCTLFGYDFPVFNVADVCVVVGVILLAVYILFLHESYTKGDAEAEKSSGFRHFLSRFKKDNQS